MTVNNSSASSDSLKSQNLPKTVESSEVPSLLSLVPVKSVARFHGVQGFLRGVWIFLTAIAVIVPLNPLLPSVGLDPSWVFTLNEAVARGWIFGKEIIFTFGPYASIFNKTYHPGTDALMLWGSLSWALCYGGVLYFLSRTLPFSWVFLYSLFIAGFLYTQDSILFSYPLMLIFAVSRFLSSPNSSLRKSKRTFFLFSSCFSLLGLLPLIKGSLLPLCAIALIASCVLFWDASRRTRQIYKQNSWCEKDSPALTYKTLAWVISFSVCFGGILFWILSGQPLSGLVFYVIYMRHMITGYTEAMAISGNFREVMFYLLTSFGIFSCFTWNQWKHLYRHVNSDDPSGQNPDSSTCFGILHHSILIASVAFFLFVGLKAGFIRHDAHAAIVGAPFIVLVALLVMTVKGNQKTWWILLIFSMITWGYIDRNHIRTSSSYVCDNLLNTYSNLRKGLHMRLFSHQKLEKRFIGRLNAIQKEFPLPLFTGSSDIYSYQQSYLLSSENQLSFRPIFQSYSAYTPELVQCNERHLRGPRAPDTILFRIEAIDGHLPSLEDGLSWPIFFHHYDAEKLENDLIYLKKRKSPRKEIQETDLFHEKYHLNDTVILPIIVENLLYVEMELKQTLTGKIRSFLFKPSKLYITIQLVDGSEVTYRLISTMAQSKFLISPLVESTSDLFSLMTSSHQNAQRKLVKSIKIHGDVTYWKKSYKLKLIQER